MEMAKAEESLRAAELCYAQDFYNSSANRAYYAMFQAAQVALETAGFVRPEWSHAGLHATFPPAGFSQEQIAELEGKIAERCIDILVEAGVFLCAAVYEPDK